MPHRPDEHILSDFADVPYEIRKWLLEYEILNHYADRLKGETDIYLSNINELKSDEL